MSTQEINNLINANIELVDEMRILKQENKDLRRALENINTLIEETKEYSCSGVIIEILDILKEVI